jgi:hypothetical protein
MTQERENKLYFSDYFGAAQSAILMLGREDDLY